jgi:hypothetical protein
MYGVCPGNEHAHVANVLLMRCYVLLNVLHKCPGNEHMHTYTHACLHTRAL